MKVKSGFLMTELGDEMILVPIDQAAEAFRGIIRLNGTATFIVNCLKEETDAMQIVERILSEYEDVTRETAEKAVQDVVNKLRSVGLIEEQ